jgi:aminocarboxymuconate-semialdehyde decarboxylase
MIESKNRYGRTAARIHDADGLARRPASPTIDIHAHIVVPQAAAVAQPHVDLSRIPLTHFADDASKDVNAQQEKDIREVMTTIDRRLTHLDQMGIDIQVIAPAPGQCYYTVDPKIGENAHRLANDGIAEYCYRKPDRFVGLGVVTLQEPELAVRELDYIMSTLKLRGVEILTNVDGQELSDPKFRPFFARAEQLGAFIMMHPNGFTHGQRLTHYYFSNVLGQSAGYDACPSQPDFFGHVGPLSRPEAHGGARWGLSAELLGTHRSRLGRAARLPRRPATTADDLSAAGLSRYGGLHLSPAGLFDRRIRS